MSGIAGETDEHALDRLRALREQEVVFHLAKRVLELHLRDEVGERASLVLPAAASRSSAPGCAST